MQFSPIHFRQLFDYVMPIFAFLLPHNDNISVRVTRTSCVDVDDGIPARAVFRWVWSFESLETTKAALGHTATPFNLGCVSTYSHSEIN